MNEATPIYFPAELPLQLDDLLTSAHVLDLRRAGKGGTIVKRIHLTTDDRVVSHGGRTDRSDDDIAGELFEAATTHADAHHRGSGKYRVIATYSKGKGGPAPSPRSFEFQVGDAEETTEATHRSDMLAEMRTDRKMLTGELLNVIRETTKLASVVSHTVSSLSDANARITERERLLAREGQEATMMREESDRNERRERMVFKLFGPMLQQLMSGKAAMGIDAMAAATTTSDGRKFSPMVSAARSLGASLNAKQLAAAGDIYGSSARERFGELADMNDDADVLSFGVWLFSKPTDDTMRFYEQLDDRQQHAAMKLNELVVAASQKSASDDDDAS